MIKNGIHHPSVRIATNIFSWLIVLMGGLQIDSCKKEDIQPLNLVSILADNVDLNGSGGRFGVATTASITATFTGDIDPTSVLSTSVTMTRDYDGAPVPLTLIVSRNILTIKSTANLLSGALYALSISSDIKSVHGVAFGAFNTDFKTAGTFVPSNQIAYWSFENSVDDVVSNHDPTSALDAVAITYAASKNPSSGKAASFDGKTSIIQVPGGAALLGPEFSISFWMYLNSDNHVDAGGKQKGNFVLGVGNVHGLQFEVEPGYAWCRMSQGLLLSDNTSTTNDFQFYANGVTNANLLGQPDSIKSGIENATTVNQSFGSAGLKARLDKTWAHIVFTFYDSTKSRSLYINGELMYTQDLGLLNNPAVIAGFRPLALATSIKFVPDTSIPAMYDDKFIFGFWQSKEATFGGTSGNYTNVDANHFHGLLDDVRIFNKSLTDKEVSLIYGDERP